MDDVPTRRATRSLELKNHRSRNKPGRFALVFDFTS
jgi:hypothetical protein